MTVHRPHGHPGSLLYCGPAPKLAAPNVVVSPGHSVAFDGDRWSMAVCVTVEDHDGRDRRRFGVHERRRALDTAVERILAVNPTVVGLRGRDVFSALPVGKRGSIEDGLIEAARRVDASFVAHTWGPPAGDDHDRYDVIVEDTGSVRRPDPR